MERELLKARRTAVRKWREDGFCGCRLSLAEGVEAETLNSMEVIGQNKATMSECLTHIMFRCSSSTRRSKGEIHVALQQWSEDINPSAAVCVRHVCVLQKAASSEAQDAGCFADSLIKEETIISIIYDCSHYCDEVSRHSCATRFSSSGVTHVHSMRGFAEAEFKFLIDIKGVFLKLIQEMTSCKGDAIQRRHTGKDVLPK